jgi:hypothetical protein
VLGSTVWLIMEQVATAALDCRAFPLASSILKQVRDKFPDSLRAARLMVRCPAARSCLVLMLRSAPAACVHARSSAVAARWHPPWQLCVVCMQEMYHEASGNYDEAAQLVHKRLEDAPDCQMLLKRQARAALCVPHCTTAEAVCKATTPLVS